MQAVCETDKFWSEEMRGFPYGEGAAAVWVVRREGTSASSPLTILFTWAWGQARADGRAERMPLGTLLKSMTHRREELVRQGGNSALWVEPLMVGGEARGSLAIWFEAEEPWRESIFLWGQRLGARLSPVVTTLEPIAHARARKLASQLTLFPVEEFEVSRRSLNPTRVEFKQNFGAPGAVSLPKLTHSDPWSRELSLPHPMSVPGIPGCIGVSREMMELGRTLPEIACSGVNVLLRGESGTGKEIISRALHLSSGRSQGPFVAQNCAALPENLFESELFGHKSGAFTGASHDKQGLIAAANGGTFFLDEIGDMPLLLQIKLLRVMQERRVRRIGDLKSTPVDIRFVAATHQDLEAAIAAKQFRLDLFYRLKVVSLEIPPLRHRPEDIAPLFTYFLRSSRSEQRGTGCAKITERALACLQSWSWPGNVRELENEVKRFCALHGDERTIRVEHLSPEIQGAQTRQINASDLGVLRELTVAHEALEQFLIRKALAATEGRKAAAARRLGVSRQGLYKKIQRYGMSDLIGGN